jgi:hypothetical protein
MGEPYLLGGDASLSVVGESYYQISLRRLAHDPQERVRIDIRAVLVAETDNHYDPEAISVWIEQLQVGHLSRDDAHTYRPGLLILGQAHREGIALRGDIVGAEMLGVFLRHDPADFGVDRARPPWPHAGRLRTGLSDALSSDEADDSYDLGWMNALPLDSSARVLRLRELLTKEPDPLDRHFMFHELEAALYKARNVIPSALGDFDQVCREHDAEMEALRRAFIAKWGVVPVLTTYRQMCVRELKAHKVAEALWWAERGIAVYGSDAARAEAVEDLKERAAEYRSKVQAAGRT